MVRSGSVSRFGQSLTRNADRLSFYSSTVLRVPRRSRRARVARPTDEMVRGVIVRFACLPAARAQTTHGRGHVPCETMVHGVDVVVVPARVSPALWMLQSHRGRPLRHGLVSIVALAVPRRRRAEEGQIIDDLSKSSACGITGSVIACATSISHRASVASQQSASKRMSRTSEW